jgi:hypothetical protein
MPNPIENIVAKSAGKVGAVQAMTKGLKGVSPRHVVPGSWRDQERREREHQEEGGAGAKDVSRACSSFAVIQPPRPVRR